MCLCPSLISPFPNASRLFCAWVFKFKVAQRAYSISEHIGLLVPFYGCLCAITRTAGPSKEPPADGLLGIADFVRVGTGSYPSFVSYAPP